MFNQTVIIDFTITSSSISKPSHWTSLAHIEVKINVGENKNALIDEGKGQAISYLAQTTLSSDNEAHLKKFRVGIFTNGETITFFRFADGDYTYCQMSR